jgi:hypothetical protein
LVSNLLPLKVACCLKSEAKFIFTRWFKYDRDWFVCKQVALRSSCVTLREWSHNLHSPSCSGYNLFSPVWELLEWWAIMVTKKKISPGNIWTILYMIVLIDLFIYLKDVATNNVCSTVTSSVGKYAFNPFSIASCTPL